MCMCMCMCMPCMPCMLCMPSATPYATPSCPQVGPGGALYVPFNVALIVFFNYYYTFLQVGGWEVFSGHSGPCSSSQGPVYTPANEVAPS